MSKPIQIVCSKRDHESFMRHAIMLARKVDKAPFGAVIVDPSSNRIVSEGVNRTEENPVLHGEIDAILKLSESRDPIDTDGLVIYSTAEPCPMCQSAIIWSGMRKVVFGTSIPTLMKLGWRQIEISSTEVVSRSPFANCEVVGGVLEDECNELYRRT